MTLIAFTGKKYAGKDTAAKALLDMGYQKLSFAAPMKKMLAAWWRSSDKVDVIVRRMADALLAEQGVSGYDRTEILGESKALDSNYFGGCSAEYVMNTLIAWGQDMMGGAFWNFQEAWTPIPEATIAEMLEGDLKETEILQFLGKTPRYVMQKIGTEWGRQTIGENFWVDVGIRRAALMRSVVITDVRFDNEAEAVRDVGGILIRVTRGDLGPTHDIHLSEQGVSDQFVSTTLVNDDTVERLQMNVSSYVNLALQAAA